MREPLRFVERFVDALLQLVETRRQRVRIFADREARELDLDGESNEVLLEPVVEVALDPPALCVRVEYEPLARCAELSDLVGPL